MVYNITYCNQSTAATRLSGMSQSPPHLLPSAASLTWPGTQKGRTQHEPTCQPSLGASWRSSFYNGDGDDPSVEDTNGPVTRSPLKRGRVAAYDAGRNAEIPASSYYAGPALCCRVPGARRLLLRAWVLHDGGWLVQTVWTDSTRLYGTILREHTRRRAPTSIPLCRTS